MLARVGRFLVFCLGVLLLLWGTYMPLVALLGSQAEGRITHVRRQLGDRAEPVSNRYTYMISYEFKLPDGRIVTGHTQRVGDFFSPRHLVVGKRVDVRYFPLLPSIGVVERNWWGVFENIVVAGVGATLMYLLAFRKEKPRSGARRGRASRS